MKWVLGPKVFIVIQIDFFLILLFAIDIFTSIENCLIDRISERGKKQEFNMQQLL